MPGSKEIRNKIKSVQNTRKITKAMEMVAAAKMRKAQERTKATRPYVLKLADIIVNIARANAEYRHPFMVERPAKRVGAILITTDKGLCGGLNTNILRLFLNRMKEWQAAGVEAEVCAIGNKGFGFANRMGAKVVSHVIGLGDAPKLERLIGPVKVLIDGYLDGRLDEIHVFFSRFVNTMRQDPWESRLIPIRDFYYDEKGHKVEARTASSAWDYIYEPGAREVLDELFVRYIEALVYQSVAENMASEQSARMVAMKAASDNAGNVIDELTLVLNKTRQAAITKEISEIVGGAAAV